MKQVDFDGNFFYTDVKVVELQKSIASNNIGDLIISTYPNPNKDLLNIDIETSQQKNVTINLFDANGKNIVNQKQVIENGKQTYQLNTSQLAPGVYLLNIVDKNNASISKQKLIIY